MEGDEYLELRLDWWDDTVGAFEPAKVLRQILKKFPGAEIDWTDQQEVRLQRELELFSQAKWTAETLERMTRQAKNLYRTNGPTYRFLVPVSSGQQVRGLARRMSVGFAIPQDLPAVAREQLLAFLRSLKMGEPTLGEDLEDAEPDATAEPAGR